jgi:hypothetical protein
MLDEAGVKVAKPRCLELAVSWMNTHDRRSSSSV